MRIGLRLREVALERIELALPEDTVLRDPIGGLLHGPGGEPAVAHAPYLVLRNKPGLFEDAKVLHDRRQRHAMRLGEFGNGSRALGESRDHGPASGIGESREGSVKTIRMAGILNHLV